MKTKNHLHIIKTAELYLLRSTESWKLLLTGSTLCSMVKSSNLFHTVCLCITHAQGMKPFSEFPRNSERKGCIFSLLHLNYCSERYVYSGKSFLHGP